MSFLLYGPKRYLYGILSHEACRSNDFCIAFDTLIPCDGHIHNFLLILTHDSGTTEHQLSPIAT